MVEKNNHALTRDNICDIVWCFPLLANFFRSPVEDRTAYFGQRVQGTLRRRLSVVSSSAVSQWMIVPSSLRKPRNLVSPTRPRTKQRAFKMTVSLTLPRAAILLFAACAVAQAVDDESSETCFGDTSSSNASSSVVMERLQELAPVCKLVTTSVVSFLSTFLVLRTLTTAAKLAIVVFLLYVQESSRWSGRSIDRSRMVFWLSSTNSRLDASLFSFLLHSTLLMDELPNVLGDTLKGFFGEHSAALQQYLLSKVGSMANDGWESFNITIRGLVTAGDKYTIVGVVVGTLLAMYRA
ncbi:expressed unknown protein [Seminavis robusta]|uniref:Transmembrane protein n=1 Tax=Seminavis robusta TaxID=568900 RepID=A0A9N8H6P5_9STRA|nr:expressed unknown protein [Seminavis robusta]|eukprot:Sro154_g069900.1 n/a (295) ;mRNA; f:20684-21568